MPVTSTWTCTFCNATETVKGTSRPSIWNVMNLSVKDNKREKYNDGTWPTTYMEIHFCDRCSETFAQEEKSEGFYQLLRRKFGVKD